MGILAQKSGIYGMIGGQTLDVELTKKPVNKEQLEFIYRLQGDVSVLSIFLVA